MLENLLWDRRVIRWVSSHFESGEKMPDTMIDQVLVSRHKNDALGKLGALFHATYDLTIHTPPDHETIRGVNLAETFNRLRSDMTLLPGLEGLGMGLEPSHGYTWFRAPVGGYAATYYAYIL